jgi:hypothetical protein
MNALVIGDNEYVIPTDFTISEWREVMSKPDDEAIIAACLKCSEEEARSIPDDTKELLLAFLQQALFPSQSYRKSNMKDFDRFSFGEFVDLEVYHALGVIKHIEEISKMLHKDLSHDVKISEVWSGYLAYSRYRKALFFSYKNLFESSGSSEEGQPVNVASKWYDVVMTVANGDLTKMNEITDMPTIKVLNWLAWNKDKQRELQQ